MKRNFVNTLFLLLTMTIVAFQSSCSKDGEEELSIDLVDDKPGQIPGLGKTKGELTGKAFSFPEGIKVEGEIRGSEEGLNSFSKADTKLNNKSEALKAALNLKAETGPSIGLIKGSGQVVIVAIPLLNTTGKEKEIILPAGFIIKSISGKFQNGILLKKTSFKIAAKQKTVLHLMMYCGNESLSASSPSETYSLSVVSNSKSLHELIDKLKNKKINIEQFANGDYSQYYYMVLRIQGILWKITDSTSGMEKEDFDYISSLQND